MTKADLATRIRAIISDQLAETYIGDKAAQEVTDASRIDVLGLDGLDCIEIGFAIEDEHDIELPDDFMSDLKTVADVVAYVARVLGISDAEAA